jgi:hypothetical protein
MKSNLSKSLSWARADARIASATPAGGPVSASGDGEPAAREAAGPIVTSTY